MSLTRREMLAASVAAAGVAALGPRSAAALARTPGRLRQSVSRWPYDGIPLPEFARAVNSIGLEAIDLL